MVEKNPGFEGHPGAITYLLVARQLCKHHLCVPTVTLVVLMQCCHGLLTSLMSPANTIVAQPALTTLAPSKHERQQV